LTFQDPWLSIALVEACQKLWVRGATSTPEINYDLPPGSTRLQSGADSTGTPIPHGHPHYSPNNGLDVFVRYHKAFPETRPFRLLTLIGTADLCHVGCVEMGKKMGELGDCVEFEMVEVRVVCLADCWLSGDRWGLGQRERLADRWIGGRTVSCVSAVGYARYAGSKEGVEEDRRDVERVRCVGYEASTWRVMSWRYKGTTWTSALYLLCCCVCVSS
jgi:hypothetical protein